MQHGQLHHHFFKTIDLPQLPSPIWSLIRTQAKWFWRVFGEFSMGITLVRYPCCHDLVHPHHLTFNIGLLLFFPFLSRGRTGLGGGLSPTPVKSCFGKIILKNWHGCRFSKFYPSIIFSSLQNFLWFFQFSSWAESVLPPRHSSTRRLEGFILIIIIIIIHSKSEKVCGFRFAI